MTERHTSGERRARLALVTLVTAVAIGSVFYRLLVWQDLEHTSMVFIGIPALLAIVVALMPNPQSATGLIVKVITLILLISGVVFGEGFVCILFAAPLFYFVGIVIGTLVDRWREGRPQSIDLHAVLLIGLAVTPASLEGVVPGFEFPREERVTVRRLVHGSPDEVASALARAPRFTRPLPAFFRLGFPTPGATSGSGLRPGDMRRVEFVHGHHPGVLTLRVERREPGLVDFAAVSDDSYLTHWLSWRRAEVRWRAVRPDVSEVSWTLTYRRRLDPAWYFKPLERHGASLAAGYLIDTLATPGR